MLTRFLHWLLGPPKINVEVTINVPEIHVFTNGSEGSKAQPSASRSGVHAEEEGFKLGNAPEVTDEERLSDFEKKFTKFKAPEINLGQDQKTDK